MRVKFSAIVFCFLVAAAVLATPKARSLDVRPTGRELFQTKPREIVTATFRVTNTDSQAYEFISEVDLPEGWMLITEDFPFQLSADESTTKVLSFFVPEATSAGKYKVTYRVQARKYPALRDFYSIEVVIFPHSRLEVKLLEGPQYAIAGRNYRALFSVTNSSNMENTISIKVESEQSIAFTVEPRLFKLGPGRTEKVSVSVMPGSKISKILDNRLRLTAQIIQEGKLMAQAKAEQLTVIIPQMSDTDEPLRAIAAETTIEQITEKTRSVEFVSPKTLDKQSQGKEVAKLRTPVKESRRKPLDKQMEKPAQSVVAKAEVKSEPTPAKIVLKKKRMLKTAIV